MDDDKVLVKSGAEMTPVPHAQSHSHPISNMVHLMRQRQSTSGTYMLTKDENMPEANSNEDNEMPKLTVLHDYEEMMKGRQKELKLSE